MRRSAVRFRSRALGFPQVKGSILLVVRPGRKLRPEMPNKMPNKAFSRG